MNALSRGENSEGGKNFPSLIVNDNLKDSKGISAGNWAARRTDAFWGVCAAYAGLTTGAVSYYHWG